MRKLAAFDFDHTIIQDNTDTVVAALIKGGIPQKLKEQHKKEGWTSFMQGVFDILHSNKVGKEIIHDTIVQLEPIDGMITLIENLVKELNFDVIVISDSNSYFINNWLKEHNLSKHILKVFTNPADFINGALKIQMYHLQEHCDLSTKNLCKGQILEEFIQSQKCNNVNYDEVIYVGDGSNDFCPILKLNEGDNAFVRDKYKCSELISKAEKGEIKDKSGAPYSIKSQVHYWKTGFDILEILKGNLEKQN